MEEQASVIPYADVTLALGNTRTICACKEGMGQHAVGGGWSRTCLAAALRAGHRTWRWGGVAPAPSSTHVTEGNARASSPEVSPASACVTRSCIMVGTAERGGGGGGGTQRGAGRTGAPGMQIAALRCALLLGLTGDEARGALLGHAAERGGRGEAGQQHVAGARHDARKRR